MKTKSEISALIDFITWLESVKGDAADGIILVYHEPRKVIPSMLLESLRKFNLLDRFNQTVKGFANGFNVAEVKCADTVRTFSLRTLSRVMLDKVYRSFFPQLRIRINCFYLLKLRSYRFKLHFQSLSSTKYARNYYIYIFFFSNRVFFILFFIINLIISFEIFLNKY